MEQSRAYIEKVKKERVTIYLPYELFPFAKRFNIEDKGSADFTATITAENKNSEGDILKRIRFDSISAKEIKND